MPLAVLALVLSLAARAEAQSFVNDADLEAASLGRVVRVGPASGSGRATAVPLEVYVARVLAGEAELRAGDSALQALAVAIRTFALANAARHVQAGFDLCDGTHCQVPRAATAVTRRAAAATAGRILTWNGAPAEVFYSASCGGHSESADQVWPGANFPYMPSAPDEVHQGDAGWILDLSLRDIQRALATAGYRGRLRDLEVDAQSVSGRTTRLRLVGLEPAVIGGDQFRAAIGAARLRSTAFSMDVRRTSVRFSGRGYGHGVGMCVIGAGRRAARGEGLQAILAQYYPGLEVTRLGGALADSAATSSPAPPIASPSTSVPASRPAPSAASMPTAQPSPRSVAPVSVPAGSGLLPPTAGLVRNGIVVEVPRSSAMSDEEVVRLTVRAHDDLAKQLGTSIAPLTVRVHESLESFRLATGRPWWVSSVSAGTTIDLVPAALLAQRDGFEAALRIAVAELLVAGTLKDRPLWVRVGAARHFGREIPLPEPARSREPCPSDAELTLAISAPGQRAAEARAEVCFAREYARTKDWRVVR